MVQDGGGTGDLASIDETEENGELKVYPPNRNQFQRELSRLNNEMSTLRSDVERLIDHNGRSGYISEIRIRRGSIRKEREELAKAADVVKSKIAEKRTELDKLRACQIELERDCRVRSMERIDSYIKAREERYRNKNLSGKEEQLLVAEIDSLKRNRTKLEKLEETMKSRNGIETSISGLRQQNEETYRKILKLKSDQMSANNERKRAIDQLISLRKTLSELYSVRSETISSYNNDRLEYGEWLKKNKRKSSTNSSYPATFPSVHRTRNTSVCVEEDELEPFFEQKRDCKRLIAYLKNLDAQTEKDAESHVVDDVAGADSGSDSADDFTPGIARLAVSSPQPQRSHHHQNETARKGFHCKKAKWTQPISHAFDMYNLFGSVEVSVPSTYQDVSRALEEVKRRLVFFEQETTIIDWDEVLKGLGSYMNLSDISRTVSEFTGDSACPDSASDCASLVSYRNRRNSMESPTSPPFHRTHANTTSDEGMSSAHSSTMPVESGKEPQSPE